MCEFGIFIFVIFAIQSFGLAITLIILTGMGVFDKGSEPECIDM